MRKLTGGLNRCAGLLLLAMMTLTVADVLLRKLWGSGALGGWELSEFLLAGTVFCALAEAEQEDRHIRVDWLGRFGRSRAGAFVLALAQLLSALLMGAIAHSALVYALAIRSAAEVSPDLGIPRYPLILVASLGCALLALVLLLRGMETLAKARRP